MERCIVDSAENHTVRCHRHSAILTGNGRTKKQRSEMQVVFPVIAHLVYHIDDNTL